MNREVLSKYNDMSVGEAAGITLAQEPELVDDRRHELNEIFNFDAVRVNRRGGKVEPLVLTDLKAIYTNHEKVLGKHDWDTSSCPTTTIRASSPPSATTPRSSASPPPSSSRP